MLPAPPRVEKSPSTNDTWRVGGSSKKRKPDFSHNESQDPFYWLGSGENARTGISAQQQQHHHNLPCEDLVSEKKTSLLRDGDEQNEEDDGFGPGLFSRNTTVGPDGAATTDGSGEEVLEFEQQLWEIEKHRLGLWDAPDSMKEEEESEGPGPMNIPEVTIPDRWRGLGGCNSPSSEVSSSDRISHGSSHGEETLESLATNANSEELGQCDGTENMISWSRIVRPRLHKEQRPSNEYIQALTDSGGKSTRPETTSEPMGNLQKKKDKKVKAAVPLGELKEMGDEKRAYRAPLCRFCMFCGEARVELAHSFCPHCGQRYPADHPSPDSV